METPSFRGRATGDAGDASRELLQWMQQIIDQPLGQMVVTSDGVCPGIKKHQTILWRDTTLGATYMVHYDGSHKYFWIMAGTDLY